MNELAPGGIPSGLTTLLPGYSDEVALRLGLLEAPGDVESARRRFLINERARAGLASDDFSARIRRAP